MPSQRHRQPRGELSCLAILLWGLVLWVLIGITLIACIKLAENGFRL